MTIVVGGLLGPLLLTGGFGSPTPTPTPTSSPARIAPEGFRIASVPSGAGIVVVCGMPGRLIGVLATSAGTGAGSVLFYDNATTNSGTIVGIITATIAAGNFYAFDFPVAFGIVCVNPANGPAMTVSIR